MYPLPFLSLPLHRLTFSFLYGFISFTLLEVHSSEVECAEFTAQDLMVWTQICFVWLHDKGFPVGHPSLVSHSPHHFYAMALVLLAHPQVGLAPMGIPDENPKLEPLSPKLCKESRLHSWAYLWLPTDQPEESEKRSRTGTPPRRSFGGLEERRGKETIGPYLKLRFPAFLCPSSVSHPGMF